MLMLGVVFVASRIDLSVKLCKLPLVFSLPSRLGLSFGILPLLGDHSAASHVELKVLLGSVRSPVLWRPSVAGTAGCYDPHRPLTGLAVFVYRHRPILLKRKRLS